MVAVEELTQLPEEQELIRAFDEVLPVLHRDVNYHGYPHPRNQVLPEVLRLDDLGRKNTRQHAPRRVEIADALTHDIRAAWPLDPNEPYATKEERSAEEVRPILADLDYTPRQIDMARRDIPAATEAGRLCTNERQIKLRRGDLVTVPARRAVFLSASVNIFLEHIFTELDQGHTPLSWPAFVRKQQGILLKLLGQDLTLAYERRTAQDGAFNRAAMRNVNWLSSEAVLNPFHFAKTYGRSVLSAIPGISVREFIDRAA